jgi:predicted RecA/RadA family phage recombinase
MKNQYSPGNTIDIASAPYACLSGAGMLVGSIFGVNGYDSVLNGPATLSVNGAFTLAKLSAQAWAVGNLIYWDDTAKNCTTVVGTNKLIGVAVLAAPNPSATGVVRLNGSFNS